MEGLLEALKRAIADKVLVTEKDRSVVDGRGENARWLFDFRNIILSPTHINRLADIFWEKCEEKYPFQVGGLEVAAIPLVTAIVMKSFEKGKPVNGFFIRKSRKKIGLQKIIEGELNDERVILVDDLINSGNSILRQIDVMESVGKKVSEVFTIMRFRDENEYRFLRERRVILQTLFTLKDFGIEMLKPGTRPREDIFLTKWSFKSKNPNYFYVVPKSAPALDEQRVYFGSDSGNFWALNQEDGSIAWKYKVGWHTKGKSIFSSPAVHGGAVYFGSYDGNVYALDAETGKKKWAYMEADWVGSSPTIAADLGLLFIGLEFGLFKKRGGIAALDLKTGKRVWEYTMPEYTHSSPAYMASKSLVVVGSNDSTVYAFNAKSGRLIWQRSVGAEIKASFTFDEKRGFVLFGSFDGNLYCLKAETGELIFRYQTRAGIYSTPLIHGDAVIVASLDKRVYCISLDSGELRWVTELAGRIFASPALVEGRLYLGCNDGRLYEINPDTGKKEGFFQATERITNKIAYNEKTKRFFLPTYANELFCLTKKADR